MPAESPKSKKKSSKKLTKAEKDKLKKEAAERRAKEEEEARVREEQEAIERKERDKHEAEERRIEENIERVKRRWQKLELDELWNNHRNWILSQQLEAQAKAKWGRYMRCDGSPDPTIKSEINTYMNVCREDRNHDVTNVLKESDRIIELINELDGVIAETPSSDAANETLIRDYKETLRDLESFLREQLDSASYDLLSRATSLQDSETQNLQRVYFSDSVTLCMWGNLIKNPRMKSFEFTEKGFTFEIPRVLVLSDCAIRVLFTAYDHYSPRCGSYHSRRKIVRKEVDAKKEEEKEEMDDKGDEDEVGERSEKSQEEARATTEDALQDTISSHSSKKSDEKRGQKDESAVSKSKEDEAFWEEDVEIATPEPQDFDEFVGNEDVVDLRSYHVVGGVFHFDLLQMLPQPKMVKQWTITRLASQRLAYVEYVADSVGNANNQKNGNQSNSNSKEADGGKKEQERPAIGITMKLPPEVYFCEEPQVARWDEKRKEWKLDGFTDTKYDESNRCLTFRTAYFGTMALFQDVHINMPFQSWELRPRETNNALLTIIAAIVELQIEIKNDLCRLNQVTGHAELKHLSETWIPPEQLIEKMRFSGINVFPAVDSHKFVQITEKNPATEDRLYQQMALTASCMAYTWSKWNGEVKNREKIVLQATEHLIDEPLLEEAWSMFLVTKKRTTKLNITELSAETFSEESAPGTSYNFDLYHLTLDLASPRANERLQETSHQFMDCVYKLLRATRLITYS